MTTDRPLPAGTVTFVFTDIEQSTRLLRALGDRYPDVLERHRALLRASWERWGGCEVDSQGDSFFVAFPDATSAARACVDAQRSVVSEPWPGDGTVRVRMGLHTGLAAPVADRYVALAVHQAARVADAGHGGQIVASQAGIAELARDGDAPPVRAESLGRYRVRDFERPVELFQLVAPGLPASFPAVRAVPADRHNLSPPATPLVGRDRDVAGLDAAVGQHRLVTVVGPGGVGKTRLVTDFGIRTADRWDDGVWLVDCAPLADVPRLRRALVEVLGPAAGVPDGDWEDLVARLRRGRLLVVLDGCEPHAPVVADVVSALLAACPGVHVLATSTEPLRVPGEVLRRLDPLAVDSGPESPAVDLFLERARAVHPGLRADGDTAATVEAICRRLDGLPLALEIAAAKLTALQPAEVLAGLERRFELLRERDGPRPPRHRTLRALLDWSYRLLPDDEKAALRRMSAFAGAFDLDAAMSAVSGGGVERESVPVLVWSLVDRSLVVADPAAGGTRYRLLETVRAYADGLPDDAERAECRARLVAHYLARVGPGLGTGRPWVHAVAADLATIRLLLGRTPAPGDAAAQSLATSVARYHDAVETYRDGITEITAFLARLTAPTSARVGLMSALGDLHLRVGDPDGADRLAREAVDLRRRVGGPEWDEAGVEKLAGEIALHRGDAVTAVAIARRALGGDLSARGRARMDNLLGIALATLGDNEGAAVAFAGELAAAAELADETLLAHAHANAAEVALRRHEIAVAAVHQRTSLDLALALGRTAMIAYGMLAAARIATSTPAAGVTDWRVAARLVARATDLLAETGTALHDTDRQVTDAWHRTARDRLGAGALAAAQAAGHAMTTEAALASAGEILAAATGARSSSPC